MAGKSEFLSPDTACALDSCRVEFLTSDNQRLWACKCRLASVSTYFHTMFNGSFRDEINARTQLKCLETFEQLHLFLRCVATEDKSNRLVPTDLYSLDLLLPLADMFQCKSLTNIIKDSLYRCDTKFRHDNHINIIEEPLTKKNNFVTPETKEKESISRPKLQRLQTQTSITVLQVSKETASNVLPYKARFLDLLAFVQTAENQKMTCPPILVGAVRLCALAATQEDIDNTVVVGDEKTNSEPTFEKVRYLHSRLSKCRLEGRLECRNCEAKEDSNSVFHHLPRLSDSHDIGLMYMYTKKDKNVVRYYFACKDCYWEEEIDVKKYLLDYVVAIDR